MPRAKVDARVCEAGARVLVDNPDSLDNFRAGEEGVVAEVIEIYTPGRVVRRGDETREVPPRVGWLFVVKFPTDVWGVSSRGVKTNFGKVSSFLFPWEFSVL